LEYTKNNELLSFKKCKAGHGKKWFCYGNKIKDNKEFFLLLQPKILLQQPHVLLMELNILML